MHQNTMYLKQSGNLFIRASLSEPHTSVTALRMCVCMSACLFACGHIPKILIERTDVQICTRAKANSCSVNELHTDGSTENDCGQRQTRAGCSQMVPSNHAQ